MKTLGSVREVSGRIPLSVWFHSYALSRRGQSIDRNREGNVGLEFLLVGGGEDVLKLDCDGGCTPSEYVEKH